MLRQFLLGLLISTSLTPLHAMDNKSESEFEQKVSTAAQNGTVFMVDWEKDIITNYNPSFTKSVFTHSHLTHLRLGLTQTPSFDLGQLDSLQNQTSLNTLSLFKVENDSTLSTYFDSHTVAESRYYSLYSGGTKVFPSDKAPTFEKIAGYEDSLDSTSDQRAINAFITHCKPSSSLPSEYQEALIDVINNNSFLATLSLESQNMLNIGKLTNASITALSIHHPSDNKAEELVQGLNSLSSLAILSLGQNIKPERDGPIFHSMVEDLGFTPLSLEILATAVMDNSNMLDNLQDLRITMHERTVLNSSQAQGISSLFEHIPNLTALKLNNIELDAEGAYYLTNALAPNTALTTLGISWGLPVHLEDTTGWTQTFMNIINNNPLTTLTLNDSRTYEFAPNHQKDGIPYSEHALKFFRAFVQVLKDKEVNPMVVHPMLPSELDDRRRNRGGFAHYFHSTAKKNQSLVDILTKK